MKALVLTGGFGTRLREIINDRPKVMAPVGNEPFLAFLLKDLKNNGITEVVLSVGYLGDYIKDYFKDGGDFGIKIIYSEENTPLGTGGAVKVADKYFTEPYFVLNGDTNAQINFPKFLDFHLKHKSRLTLAVSLKKDTGESGFVKLDKLGKVQQFVEKRKDCGLKKTGWINSGVYVINPRIIKSVKKSRFSLERDFFQTLISRGKIYGFKNNRNFIDIGTPQNYLAAKKFLENKKGRVVESKVPTRVSFSGGGTDFPEFFKENGGFVVGTAINKFAHVKLKALEGTQIKINLLDFGKEQSFPTLGILKYDGSEFDHFKAVINRLKPKKGFEANVWGEFIPNSGLATSSAVTIAFICAVATFLGKKMKPLDLVHAAIDVERSELKIAGGWQDQYLCGFGGLNVLEFYTSGEVKVRKLILLPNTIKKLQENLLLVFVNGERTQNEQQEFLVNTIDDLKITDNLKSLKEISIKISKALTTSNLKKFGLLLDEAWSIKKRTSSKISNNRIDEIYNTAKKYGTLGGKLLGAGGAGYMLLYCPSEHKSKVEKELNKLGVYCERLDFVMTGPVVKVYEG